MTTYDYLNELAASQPNRQMKVRVWDNKQLILRKNLNQNRGLVTQVWDAWLRQELRRFSGFEPVIEVDEHGDRPMVKFYTQKEVADAVHFILHADDSVKIA
ncbi:hypothetical protein [Lacticaseibacillus brantae]|uniref:Uncharacterized protein n=1 Tax=Lacticaseibacillus brantae DSM 23927 TaxID=1423727 RepID=A0A0R2B810_9LACO|nr:hypothetical protein [Lacticaseibacillus brantae]KRM71747.1 hypothetical protein FC34_GL001406 [Lacticaseibacillus brantae DSM 23927]